MIQSQIICCCKRQACISHWPLGAFAEPRERSGSLPTPWKTDVCTVEKIPIPFCGLKDPGWDLSCQTAGVLGLLTHQSLTCRLVQGTAGNQPPFHAKNIAPIYFTLSPQEAIRAILQNSSGGAQRHPFLSAWGDLFTSRGSIAVGLPLLLLPGKYQKRPLV